MSIQRQRLDTLLVERGLAESRAKAQGLIYAGNVLIKGQPVVKPGSQIGPEAVISLKSQERFVSRGGEKLDYALNFFNVNMEGKICLDAGASTGGFTDCLLQRGAQKVIAVDVGLGQLHWKLRDDPRIVVMDKTNARYLAPAQFAVKPQIAVADVSFISLTKVLPAVLSVLASDAEIIALVKPQFEAERKEAKRGVVRSDEVRLQVLEKIKKFGEDEMHLAFKGSCASPLKGPAGNVEYFIYWTTAG